MPYNETNLAADSDYGPHTANAVRDVQYWGNITQDGIYGQHTRDEMGWPTAPGWNGASCGGL
jgi:peptidoglycan hydrolase-like protein with peptidoglycan-binding domain